ncbi:MAG TPA: hypothetical protein VNW92_09105, partial [Polyangiaceae bacterium]|nr:hypothetical protein [Polyangiaceae bacterium]
MRTLLLFLTMLAGLCIPSASLGADPATTGADDFPAWLTDGAEVGVQATRLASQEEADDLLVVSDRLRTLEKELDDYDRYAATAGRRATAAESLIQNLQQQAKNVANRPDASDCTKNLVTRQQFMSFAQQFCATAQTVSQSVRDPPWSAAEFSQLERALNQRNALETLYSTADKFCDLTLVPPLGSSEIVKQFRDYVESLTAQIRPKQTAATDAVKNANTLRGAVAAAIKATSEQAKKLKETSQAFTFLPTIVIEFFAFSIVIMVVVTAFSPRIQFELVASGQVIQLMTVSILLIAILGLGLARIIQNDTLGTLLGGVA